MGIDEGTASARTLVFDEEGQIVAEAARELTQHYPGTGWVHHNPTEILQAQLGTMRQVLEEAKLSPQDIRAIGPTNQRETALVWDKASGQPVYNAIVWSSRQTVDIAERWAAGGLNEDIRRKTGLPNDAWFSASKIAWILENVEGARQKAERGELLAGSIDSWLIWNLTGGQRHVTDYSNASRTTMFNIHTLRWDEELCDAFGIPLQMLPEVVPSDADFGSVGPSFGAEIGMSRIEVGPEVLSLLPEVVSDLVGEARDEHSSEREVFVADPTPKRRDGEDPAGLVGRLLAGRFAGRTLVRCAGGRRRRGGQVNGKARSAGGGPRKCSPRPVVYGLMGELSLGLTEETKDGCKESQATNRR